jgi:hypothetical protein
MAISGPQMRSSLPTLEDLFAGFDVEALDRRTGSPAVRVDPFDPERSGRFLFPRERCGAIGTGDLGAAVGRR